MTNKLPTFLVVGAAKCGSTSLYHYLDAHPDVYMSPIKETNYFAADLRANRFSATYRRAANYPGCIKRYGSIDNYLDSDLSERVFFTIDIQTLDQYRKLFKNVCNEKAIGEVSNSYLFSPIAAAEIRRTIPDVRIVMILRDPIRRMWSHYRAKAKTGLLARGFRREIMADMHKKRKGWCISHNFFEMGRYYAQVKRYYDLFPHDKILVLLNEDLKERHRETLAKLYGFLGVKMHAVPATKHNTGPTPRSALLANAMRRARLSFGSIQKLPPPLNTTIMSVLYRPATPRPPLDEKLSRLLTEYYRDDVKRLADLINRDLSAWLQIE
ncbi:MAG: hypothetical protein GF344_12745 [Chitinivibrionales bacterium]|nr:hypothetical protein [Chitinivibrionales bacterium]MBD3357611.1 hypothetical protein [Chitinivibrionales bacterium]